MDSSELGDESKEQDEETPEDEEYTKDEETPEDTETSEYGETKEYGEIENQTIGENMLDRRCNEEPGVVGTCTAQLKRWTFMKMWGCYYFIVWIGSRKYKIKFLELKRTARHR
eukprot:TRINITY_DN6913_c0_g1_i1.p1 TRINITY_DN6913_c0_g1~~TRINITY_DN6913_c0_g1_i1.p1  ORF type:complete len:113 (+),score=28.16 TRINITY_DN6913_c0_g1_i1:189-527(+)